jgi:copper chaperone CopZ
MKKTFDMEELDCAHCAAKMEEGIRRLEGVIAVSVNFLTQKLTLEAEDALLDKVLKQAAKICRRVDDNCRIVIK